MKVKSSRSDNKDVDEQNWLFKTIVQYLLKPASLNAILLLFVLFIVGEITAITSSDKIEPICDHFQEKYDNDAVFLIVSIIRVLYTDGEWSIVLLAIVASTPFIFLKFIELSQKKVQFKSGLVVLLGLMSTVCFTIFFITEKNMEIESMILFDETYVGSKNVPESFRFENIEYSLFNDGVFHLEGKQTNGRFVDWEGYMEFNLVNHDNKTVVSFNTKKFACPARGVSGNKYSQSIVFDTILPAKNLDKVAQIKINEIAYEVE